MNVQTGFILMMLLLLLSVNVIHPLEFESEKGNKSKGKGKKGMASNGKGKKGTKGKKGKKGSVPSCSCNLNVGCPFDVSGAYFLCSGSKISTAGIEGRSPVVSTSEGYDFDKQRIKVRVKYRILGPSCRAPTGKQRLRSQSRTPASWA